MDDNQRPRGRHTMLRAVCATTIATMALGAGAAVATAQETVAPPAVELLATDAPSWAALAAGPDGAIWSFEHRGESKPAIARYGGAGRLSQVTVDAPVQLGVTPPVPQADGGMAVIARGYGADHISRLLVDARGRRVTATRLPRSTKNADAFAIAPDGAVWWADTCADTLYRWRPGTRLARVRLQPAVCAGAAGSALTVGPDGAVWFVNAKQGRIVRRDARGRVRQWNFSGGRATYVPNLLVADPRGGGAAFADASPQATAAGIVTPSGRFLPSFLGMPAYRGDTVWQLAEGRVAARAAGELVVDAFLRTGMDPITITIDRAGSPWFPAGRWSSPPSSDSVFHDIAIGTVRSGQAVIWPVAGERRGTSQLADAPTPIVLGGDGALWTRVEIGWGEQKILRVVPPGLRAPRKPVARVTGVLARTGRTVVLQVRCSADRGRFCRGTVGLGGSAKAVRYIAPGQSGAAVSLTLTRRAAARLRRAGALKLGAQVRSTGAGTTRATVRLRR